jgi:exosortase N
MNISHNRLNISLIKSNRPFLFTALIMLTAVLVSIQNLNFYLRFDFNFTLSLLLVPFVLYVKHKNHQSVRFGIASLVFLSFYPVLKIQSFYFFGFSFFLLFVIESHLGKLNNLPVFLLILLSPVAIFAIEVFGFPIRLWLTNVSAQIISFVNDSIQSSGNQIFFNGEKFTVDPECMGLKMVITGYLLTLVIIAWFERRSKLELSFLSVILILFTASILIIISNLFRIIGIIFAKAAPETLSHELIGVSSLIIYVILPVYFLCRIFYKKFSKTIKAKPEKKLKKGLSYGLSIILLLSLALLNLNRENYRSKAGIIQTKSFEMEGYQCNQLENGVSKLTNDSALVYIKPIPNFYSADHTPMICWKGSGYQLHNQQKIKVKGHEVYFAELILENSKSLCTAWWYCNEKHITINQMEWRWQLIKGEDNFSLINVTCNNKTSLKKEIEKFLM